MSQIGFISQSSVQPTNTPWQDNYDQNATIFGQKTFLPINFEHALNDNTLVIGSSGTGKTYSFVEPNILQGNTNYIVADAKGDILAHTGESLKKMGYNIQVLNLVDLKHSMTYNPFDYMETDLDVINFGDQILATRLSGHVQNSSNQDPFWDKSAATLLSALIFFTKEFLPKEKQNMASVNTLFNLINQNSNNIQKILTSLGYSGTIKYKFDHYSEEAENLGTHLFDWARQQKPNSSAVKMWDELKGGLASERTWGSILIILGASLSAYRTKEIENLTSSNQIDFNQLLQKKSALFIIYDDADNSKNFLSNILYNQLFRFLYHKAFTYPEKRLPNKVRFYLDDFKNIHIPGFDDYLATARSRNLSICMMLQDESQLEDKFGRNYASVIGNCSSYLLTGTTDLTMAEIAAHRFNRTTQAIRTMDADHFLVDIGGYLTNPIRYDFKQHPNYVNKIFDLNSHYKTPSIQIAEPFSSLINILIDLPHIEESNDDEDENNDNHILTLDDIRKRLDDHYINNTSDDQFEEDDEDSDDEDEDYTTDIDNFIDPEDYFSDYDDNQVHGFLNRPDSYAGGLIKAEDLIHNGVPTHYYDDIFSQAYSTTYAYFTDFPFKKNLLDNSLLIKDQNSDNFLPAIDDTYDNDPKRRYVIRPAFIDFLLNQRDWYSFADAEFGTAVEKLLKAA